jgi:hypothetical protein
MHGSTCIFWAYLTPFSPPGWNWAACDAGLLALAEALPDTRIEKLSLDNSNISDTGLRALIAAGDTAILHCLGLPLNVIICHSSGIYTVILLASLSCSK